MSPSPSRLSDTFAREDRAVDTDDLEPQKKKPEHKNLEVMSIEALGEYIEELEAEIARAREAIKGKQSARLDADSVFKK